MGTCFCCLGSFLVQAEAILLPWVGWIEELGYRLTVPITVSEKAEINFGCV